ncbi:hypothetical protein DFP72DRAFT_854180 [Ephemerocybe angulata]|uniref:Uncharacterized protein n=1 Tax=Ephemerocybe angulata TaxID=980116 RepID=A0A8H6LZC6_9AGAR|nr:hypothetical protein DFP72DRAFT_854180 [Tulosesus angulatus]
MVIDKAYRLGPRAVSQPTFRTKRSVALGVVCDVEPTRSDSAEGLKVRQAAIDGRESTRESPKFVFVIVVVVEISPLSISPALHRIWGAARDFVGAAYGRGCAPLVERARDRWRRSSTSLTLYNMCTR